jgi:hypothetical protein
MCGKKGFSVSLLVSGVLVCFTNVVSASSLSPSEMMATPSAVFSANQDPDAVDGRNLASRWTNRRIDDWEYADGHSVATDGSWTRVFDTSVPNNQNDFAPPYGLMSDVGDVVRQRTMDREKNQEHAYDRAEDHVFRRCDIDNHDTSAVPVPSAVWLLGSGLAGLFASRRRR